MNGFLGALIEAWAEFRVNKARVVLSLVGVGVAVLAMTAVVGVGQIATQAQIEQLEASSGRPATLYLSTPYNSVTGQSADAATVEPVVAALAERYGIQYVAASTWLNAEVQTPNGVEGGDGRGVDVPYGEMHRIALAEGHWFTAQDADRLLPAVIINDYLWQQLGAPSLTTHPTLTLRAGGTAQAVIIGVQPSTPYENYPRFFILNSAWQTIQPASAAMNGASNWEFWVPAGIADELTARIKSEVSAAIGDGWQVSVNRNDYLAWGSSDPLGPLRLVLLGVAGLVLLLGALGLVNISLVTVRQRIREIGIRRAFGATASRVFLAVMLESVVATVVAGAIGVVLAILLVRNDFVMQYIAPGVTDPPPFPAEAALVGFLAATAVGALAGLLPALIAVRVKVIDAIRY